MKQSNMPRRMNKKRQTAADGLIKQLSVGGYTDVKGEFRPLTDEGKKRVESELKTLKSRIVN